MKNFLSPFFCARVKIRAFASLGSNLFTARAMIVFLQRQHQKRSSLLLEADDWLFSSFAVFDGAAGAEEEDGSFNFSNFSNASFSLFTLASCLFLAP